MLILGVLHFAHNLAEHWLLLEVRAPYGLHVVELRVAGLLGALVLRGQVVEVLFNLLALRADILFAAVEFIFLGADFH